MITWSEWDRCPPGAALRDADPEIARLIDREVERQLDGLELIASENFVSPAVLEAMGSPLTNKYAEGLPGKRYYGGCEFVDQVEQIAIDRAKELFGAEHANVQPHSGAQANAAAFFAFLKPGDTFLGMDLSNGGHLTHGSPVNFSGMLYHPVSYKVNDEGLIDYEQMRALALEARPKMIIAGYSAYSRVIDFARFADVAREVGAIFMVDMAHFAGLVAAGVYPSPVPHADVVTTTTHKTLRGPRGGLILCKAEHAKAIDKAVFPGTAGRSAGARDRGEGSRAQGGAAPVVQAVRGAGRGERARARGGAHRARVQRRLRRDRQSPHARGPAQQGADGQGGGAGARPRGHHREQEHGAEGDAVAVRDERNSHRHGRGDDARHEGSPRCVASRS